jgi:PAS domain S-box-containing protein
MTTPGRQTLWFVLLYIGLAGSWIIVSDYGLRSLLGVSEESLAWQTTNGLVYVAVACLVLALWFHRHIKNAHDAYQQLDEDKRMLEELVAKVSEQKRSENLHQQMFEHSPDLLFIAESDGTLRELNPAWRHVLGWPLDEIASRPWRELVHPDDLPATAAAEEQVAQGQPVTGLENRYRCLDGSYRTLAWTMIQLDPDGSIFGSGRDVTEERQIERELIQAQKMESLGHLAGGLSHDFKNLLTVIVAHTELVRMDLPEEEFPEISEALQQIIEAGSKATELADRLLVFARKKKVQVSARVNPLIKDLHKLLAPMVGKRIAIELDLDPKLGNILLDESQLEQVLMNLCVNAKDAMPQGGRLTIRTRAVSLPQSEVLKLAEGSFAEITVKDTGSGIPEEYRSRVFEPFFTTKSESGGTGLGLSTVYAIVTGAGGHVSFDSLPGDGTRFRILLPLDGDNKPEPDRQSVPAGSATVLLVDDDPVLRKALERSLGRWGYQVLAAANGGEALRLAAQYPGRIDLLLTDIAMPGISGLDLSRQLRRDRPESSVLFLSGSPEVKDSALARDGRFLEKPFRAEELARRIEEALAGTP